jgi:hypothetical protein
VRLRSSVAGITDLLFFVVTGAGIWIALTGGGQVQLSEDIRLSLTSVNNPVAIATVLAALRYLMRTWGPLLWVIDHARWMRVVDRAVSVFPKLAHTDSWVLLALGCVGVVTIKVTLAATHPGFFSGDDVEIHGMTLGRILELDWPVWDLRSPIFPMGVVYPFQAVAHAAGFTDTSDLVLAGRVAVAILSTASLLMLWKAATQEYPQRLAFVAVVLLAINKAHMAFGSTELPRPVSTVLVLGAFLVLRRWSTSAVLLSGALIGVAHTFRFSEGVFLLPFTFVLLRRGEWVRAAACAGAAVLTAGVLIAVADYAYWGHAFFSLHNAWNYTVVDGLSSRGYQEPWWYLANVGSWTTGVVVLLAIYGTRKSVVDVALCAWVPVVVLSVLPHKEGRYLVPVIPFVVLLAVNGLRLIRESVWFKTQPRLATTVVLIALALSALHDAGEWRLRRHDGGIAVAHSIRELSEPTDTVLVEQAWKIGGRLYLGGRTLVDLPPERDVDLAASGRPQVIALLARGPIDVERLRESGYSEVGQASDQDEYRIFVSASARR